MPFHVYRSGPMSYDMQGQRFCLDKKKTEIEPKEGIFVGEGPSLILRFLWPQ